MTVRDLNARRTGSESLAKPQIAIVGRGFSGMMSAIALMNRLRHPFHLQLFDPSPSVNGGEALKGAGSTTILNSRVRDLSVALGEPDDFNDWLCNNTEFRAAVPAAIPGFRQIFVPREIFSSYVYERFSQALAERRDITVQVSNEPVLSLQRQDHRFLLETEGSNLFLFDRVILATGYGVGSASEARMDPPSPVRSRRLVARPHCLLLGSGIRMVDQLLQIRDSGYDGQITIISRHGFLPQSHTPNAAEPYFPVETLPGSLKEILSLVRSACREAEEEGRSWQSVMNGLRRNARSLWRSLPAREKRQFNRHLRAIYDSHRNRLPEAIHARLKQELASGKTALLRGIVTRHGNGGVFFRATAGGSEVIIPSSRIVDCRCRAPDLSAPLLQSLFGQDLAAPDELHLGLAVNQLGEVLRDDGSLSSGLYAIGPLGLGSLPDIDLVPEIVSQAYGAAESIASQFYPERQAV